jgi:uncharacterized protein (DUF1015 family)
MAEIRPFRGIRYNNDQAGDAGSVVSPPYDVIDEKFQQELYDRNENNVVRIILGKDEEGDGPSSNRYTRARDAFQGWLEAGVLVKDEEEGIYLYAQDFEANTSGGPVRKSRLGIVTLVRADALGEGSILPHEFTMPGPKADRLELMRHTCAAFGQIFSLYSDPEGNIQSLLAQSLSGDPLFTFVDREGVTHKFWRVTDREVIDGVAAVLSDKPFFIADGHHRYETAVVYRDERAKAEGADWQGKPYGYRMHTLVNMDDTEGMAINAIHRVVTDLGEDGVKRLESGLAELFEVERKPLGTTAEVLLELRKRGEGGKAVYGLATRNGSEVQYLTLKDSVDPRALDQGNHSAAWRKLSSGLLQLVLAKVLDLDDETLTRGEKVRFVKVEEDVLNLVREAPDRAGFFLNPVGMSELREVVLAGEKMPPKSTFFYPKVYTGLVIQDLNSF